MRKAWIAALLAILPAVSGCGDSSKEETIAAATPSKNPASPPAVTPNGTLVAQPPAADRDDFVNVSGPLLVEHQVEVTAQRDGTLARIKTDAGARVKAGALLAQLDDRQITANLEAGRAKARGIENDLKNWQAETEVVKADLVRAQRLWDEGLLPQDQLQHAKFKVESEQWDVKRVTEMLNTARQEERSLELELEKTRVTAPFDCLVARRYAREGQSVARGDKLFWVTAESPLLFRFTLPEKFMGHVGIGQELEVSSSNVPQEKHTAKIKVVNSVIDPSSGTFDVLAELTGARGSLRPGMTANSRLPIPR
ncbi:MAG: efflux RND transporter periplasmic adaptor subunit [Acidobacteriota bacterium]|nr:efflux RND transporter periplasmic adaptor subunit [Acidobacteriota bacterium]